MLNTLFTLFCIQWIVVMIVDISDFPSTVKKLVSSILTRGKMKTDNFRIHLIDCDLCVTFWSGLIYLLATNQFTIPYAAFVCLLAAGAAILKDLYYTIQELITKLFNKII